MSIERSVTRMPGLVLFGLVSLSASGLAGAHGAPDVDNIPSSITKATITERPDLPGLSALILDAPTPGILISYKGEQPLTVLDSEGEAFLRFSSNQVEVNPDSSAWQSMPDSQKTRVEIDVAKEKGQSWVPLSNSGTFGWMDPRLSTPEHLDGPVTWRIPVRQSSGQLSYIEGNLRSKEISTAQIK